MSIERTLEMFFNTAGERSHRIDIVDAKSSLAANEVNAAMNSIISSNIFLGQGGDLASKKSARLITKQTEDYTMT